MMQDGPAHWSNRQACPRAAEGSDAHGWPPLLVAIAAVAIAIAAPGVWSSAASAQQTQEPALTVIEAVRAEPASIVRLQIQVGPSGVVSKNSFIRIRGLPPAAALSEGYSIAAGTWAVPLVALPTLSVILPAGLQGELNRRHHTCQCRR